MFADSQPSTSLHTHHHLWSPQQPYKVGRSSIFSILYRKTFKLGEVKWLAQGHVFRAEQDPTQVFRCGLSFMVCYNIDRGIESDLKIITDNMGELFLGLHGQTTLCVPESPTGFSLVSRKRIRGMKFKTD